MPRTYEFAIETDDPAKVIKVLTDAGYLPQLRSTTQQLVEMAKGLVRPLIIMEGITAIIWLLITGQPVPMEMWLIVGPVGGEYGAERAAKRWKQTIKGGDNG